MRISHDNNFLFTAGQDGALIISDVTDKDMKNNLRREHVGLPFSDEILTEKAEIEQYSNEKETLENELSNIREVEGVDSNNVKGKNLDDTIKKLRE